MSTTSVKHQDFVGEPMGDKEITAIAGIGNVLGERLSDKGFDKVINIYILIFAAAYLINLCFLLIFKGICPVRSIFVAKKRRRIFQRMVERNMQRKFSSVG